MTARPYSRTAIAAACLAAVSLTASYAFWPHTHTPSNETVAVGGLRAYLGGQWTFRKADRYGNGKLVFANLIDGTGFSDLWRVGGPLDEPDGTEIKLIHLANSRATSPETPKAGYWFIEIIADKKTGPYDFTKECGLCTVPAVYGVTGTPTYIVGPVGRIYTHGTPVRVFPDVDREGWHTIGSDGP
ncbi:MAG: hypothetical protein ACYTKD_00620 [Planctomycetota bacterium]|jgi:hypothetical protein